jgi:hypothetical protein
MSKHRAPTAEDMARLVAQSRRGVVQGAFLMVRLERAVARTVILVSDPIPILHRADAPRWRCRGHQGEAPAGWPRLGLA